MHITTRTKALRRALFRASALAMVAVGAAFPLNEKCHVAFVVTPDGTGNASVCAYIHNASGTLVGSGTWGIGSWTTSKIVKSAFMLGRGLWTNENPQSSYDEVRVWKIALTREQVEESIRLGPDTLPDYAYPLPAAS